MTDESGVRVVPRRSLVVTAFVSIVVVLVPVSGVLYWFAIPRGQAASVAVAQAVVIALSFVMLARQLSIDTVVADGQLRGRGIFSPMVRVPLDRIASVDLVEVYVGQSPETVPQLLVRDADGRRLYRLRGSFWYPGDLEKVAEALPVPVRRAPEALPLAEFFEIYPGSAYWFENRPALVSALVLAVAATGIAIAVGIMILIGMPIMP